MTLGVVNDQQIARELISALKKCILLRDSEKQFWLDNALLLPTTMVQSVLKEVNEKNRIIDNYLLAALEANPNKSYAEELKSMVNNARNKAIEIEEKTSSGSVEDFLEKQIQNI